jgi:hypothetical protein
MKNIIYILAIIFVLYEIFYPKYKIYKAKEEIKTVLRAHNMEVCNKIEPLKIESVIYNSGRKDDTGEIIYFTCIDKEGNIIKGEVQYHDNFSNKDSYVEINF